MLFQGDYAGNASANTGVKGDNSGVYGGARPRERSGIRTWGDLSRQGENSTSTKSCGAVQGGNPTNRGCAVPREKTSSVGKDWAQIMDAEQGV